MGFESEMQYEKHKTIIKHLGFYKYNQKYGLIFSYTVLTLFYIFSFINAVEN